MKPQLHGTNNVRCAFVIDKPLTIIGDNTIIKLDSECESQSVFIVKSSNVSFQGIHFRDANPVDFPEMPEEGVNILVSRVDHTYWQWATSFSFENAEGLSF